MSEYTQSFRGITPTRVKDQRQRAETAVILLELSVESLTLEADNNCTSAYLEGVLGFYEAVRGDYDSVLSDLKKLLSAEYDLKVSRAVRATGTDGSLTLEMELPRSKLVSLQCDHSGGRLHQHLRKVLVTEKMLKALSARDLALTYELKSRTTD